ncbi:MAG: amidohydrolase family protein [Balneolales bacterium]
MMLGSHLAGCSSMGESGSSPGSPIFNIMEEVMKYRKINSHGHIDLVVGGPENQIDFMDRLGIETSVISRPITSTNSSPELFRTYNDMVLQAVKDYPGRFIGQMTLDATFQKEALEEIDRRVDQGMVGLKLYRQVKINDPLFYPIIEKFIDLNMVILMHSGPGINRIGPKYDTINPPTLSIPEDFVDAAARYPEAMFQFAHTGGGLDWEYAIKALRDSPNVYVDVSGSNNEENMINFALKYLGEDRLLFGCDLNYYTGVGHMFSADLTEAQRKKLFFGNYNNILRKGGYHVA